MEELAAGEEGLAEGIEEEGFSEASGAGEEVEFTFVNEFFDEGGFIHVVVVFGADDFKALDTDGKFFHHFFNYFIQKIGLIKPRGYRLRNFFKRSFLEETPSFR